MADDTPLCVVAGAGSGKTAVLTRRVARRILDGSASADHSLVVTFTRKAAGELRRRLVRLGVGGSAEGTLQAGTFHAVAYGQLRRHWADTGQAPRRLLDDPRRVLGKVLEPTGPGATGPARSPTDRRALLSALEAEVHWAQARLVAPADYEAAAREAGRLTPLPRAAVADTLHRYQLAKQRKGLLDLDDLLTSAADLLEGDATAAAAVRWRLRHFYVDEFQDVNPAQWRLLMSWLGDRRDLFVVGDPRQSVYCWNGADPTLLDRIAVLLPGTSVLSLEENHRSSPQVVRAASAVLEQDEAPTSRPDGPEPTVDGFEDDRVEADAVVRWLRLAHRPGRPWSHLAVLARTHARLEHVAAALEQAGIPWRSSRGDGAATAATGRGGSVGSAVVFLRALPRDTALRAAVAELAVATSAASVPAPVPGALVRLVDEHVEDATTPTAGSFVDWLAASGGGWDDPPGEAGGDRGGADGSGPAVELATFHRAKGLQWPVVAVVGLEEGTVPIAYASTPAAVAEERRLLYVALTRAEEDLWCSWARRRESGDRSWQCEPSQYLELLHSSCRADRPVTDVPAVLDRIRTLRERLPAAG